MYKYQQNKTIFIVLHNIPDELRIDLAFDAASDLKLLANLTFIFWATETNFLKDQIEFSASAVYKINEMFTPSLGFYITDCEYTDNFYSRLNEGLNALFMTAGLKFNYDIFSADIAIADSHLFRKNKQYKEESKAERKSAYKTLTQTHRQNRAKPRKEEKLQQQAPRKSPTRRTGTTNINRTYQYNTSIKDGWINNSEVSRSNDIIPQSAGDF